MRALLMAILLVALGVPTIVVVATQSTGDSGTASREKAGDAGSMDTRYVEFDRFFMLEGAGHVRDLACYIKGDARRYGVQLGQVSDHVFRARGSYLDAKNLTCHFAVVVSNQISGRSHSYCLDEEWNPDGVLVLDDPETSKRWKPAPLATQSALFEYRPTGEAAKEIETVTLTGSWVMGSNPTTIRLQRVNSELWLGVGIRYYPLEDDELCLIEGELSVKSVGEAAKVTPNTRLKVVSASVNP